MKVIKRLVKKWRKKQDMPTTQSFLKRENILPDDIKAFYTKYILLDQTDAYSKMYQKGSDEWEKYRRGHLSDTIRFAFICASLPENKQRDEIIDAIINYEKEHFTE